MRKVVLEHPLAGLFSTASTCLPGPQPALPLPGATLVATCLLGTLCWQLQVKSSESLHLPMTSPSLRLPGSSGDEMCALEPRSHMGPRVKLTNSPSKHIHAHTQSRGLVQKMSPLTVTRHKCVFCPGEPSNPQENGWDRSFLFLCINTVVSWIMAMQRYQVLSPGNCKCYLMGKGSLQMWFN